MKAPTNVPRITPLPESEWSAEVRELLPKGVSTRSGRPLNVFTTLARHPKLLKRWMVFGNHVLGKSTLPARDRELLILRTGWLCHSTYEFHQHRIMALTCGISADEVQKVTLGPDAWTGWDRVLIQAADELHADREISDDTWKALRENYGEQQVIDLLFAVGQYTMVSMVLKSLRVQIEDETFPKP